MENGHWGEEARLLVTGGGFRSLTEAIDTTTPAGSMMMQIPIQTTSNSEA